MRSAQCWPIGWLKGAMVGLAVLIAAPSFGAPQENPPAQAEQWAIEITTDPKELPYDPKGHPTKVYPIAGRVRGIDPNKVQDFRVLVYVKTDVWYVQPTFANPGVDVAPNLTFDMDTHRGTRYVALLVTRGYKPEETVQELPQRNGKTVLAVSAIVRGQMKIED